MKTQAKNLTYIASASSFTNSTQAAGYSHDTGHRYSDCCLYRDEDGNYFVTDHVICDNGEEWDGELFALDQNKRLLAIIDPALVLLSEAEFYSCFWEEKADYVERLIAALETLL